MIHTNKLKLTLLLIGFLVKFNFFAQGNINLFDTGQQIVNIMKSEIPEKILDLIVEDDLDSKATVLESFLKVREILKSTDKLENYKHFNTVEDTNGNIYIILKNKKKFITLKIKMNEQGRISGGFKIIRGSINDSLALGEKIYKMKCFSCHGIDGKGSIGPNLTDNYWKYVNNEQELFSAIKDGEKGTMMMSFKDYLKPEELKAIFLYIKALNGKKVSNTKKPEGEKKNIKFHVF